MMWTPDDITVELDNLGSEGDVITIIVATPDGPISIMADMAIEGRTLILRRAHIDSELGPNRVGIRNLRVVAQVVMEEADCHEARVEGASRTTGAYPGHTPMPLRFVRRDRDPAAG